MPSQLSNLTNAYLKTLIAERGFSCAGLLTREELLARAEEAVAAPDMAPLASSIIEIQAEFMHRGAEPGRRASPLLSSFAKLAERRTVYVPCHHSFSHPPKPERDGDY